jgi:hypothetical protein
VHVVNAFNINFVLDTLAEDLSKVKAAIADNADMDDWETHCQLLLKVRTRSCSVNIDSTAVRYTFRIVGRQTAALITQIC